MPFDLSEYEPVEARLDRFWRDNPNGRIFTELVNGSHAGESVVMLASVYKDKADLYPDATGHAQETPGSNPVNKTSWVENCETSAIGRALANLNYAPKGHRPSREEMAKSAAPRSHTPPRARAGSRATSKKLRAAQIRLVTAAKDADVDDTLRHRIIYRLTEGYTESVRDLDDDACDKITAQLGYFKTNREASMRRLEEWEKSHA